MLYYYGWWFMLIISNNMPLFAYRRLMLGGHLSGHCVRQEVRWYAMDSEPFGGAAVYMGIAQMLPSADTYAAAGATFCVNMDRTWTRSNSHYKLFMPRPETYYFTEQHIIWFDSIIVVIKKNYIEIVYRLRVQRLGWGKCDQCAQQRYQPLWTNQEFLIFFIWSFSI